MDEFVKLEGREARKRAQRFALGCPCCGQLLVIRMNPFVSDEEHSIIVGAIERGVTSLSSIEDAEEDYRQGALPKSWAEI